MARAVVGIILGLGEDRNLQIRTPFAGIARFGVLAVFSINFYTQDLSAKPRPPQKQSDAAMENAAGQRVAPADVVTIPDGTPLSLKLRNDFSSATVKVGDTIEFTTPYPVRINGTVVVPQDVAASGTVTEILRPHRASRDSRVYVGIGKIFLPNGQTATLRAQKSESKDSKKNAKEVGNHPSMWTDPSVNAGAVVPPTIVVGAFTEKGREWVYKAGSWTTVYFNGPLTIERRALANLEPPPYKGPAQVFVNGPKGTLVDLDLNSSMPQAMNQATNHAMNHFMTGQVSLPLRIELRPGRYSISRHKRNGQAAELEVQQDHRYWIEYEHGRLTLEDPEPHRYEMEEFAVAPWVTYKIATGWFFPIVPMKP
jgi:hypothetical protein